MKLLKALVILVSLQIKMCSFVQNFNIFLYKHLSKKILNFTQYKSVQILYFNMG